jgi:hypothetical protein
MEDKAKADIERITKEILKWLLHIKQT